jgi:hypothetical protein
LNLRDENAIGAYEFLAEKGFFFTGIQPLSSSGEFMLMHNPLKYKFNMDDVVYVESQSRFAEYIKEMAGKLS